MYDLDQTIELLQRAVTEKGDAHTASCLYADDEGRPVCIVGHVFSYIELLNKAREGDMVTTQPLTILERFTPTAIQALDTAQNIQDGHGTWGEALIAAKEVQP